jgi:hypothetical protein
VSINTRVRVTLEVFIGDVKVQHQRHRTVLCERGHQFDQPPSREPLGTRVGGTSAEMVPKRIDLQLPETANRERNFHKERDQTGILTPTEVVKKVCQRLADQDSSLR